LDDWTTDGVRSIVRAIDESLSVFSSLGPSLVRVGAEVPHRRRGRAKLRLARRASRSPWVLVRCDGWPHFRGSGSLVPKPGVAESGTTPDRAYGAIPLLDLVHRI